MLKYSQSLRGGNAETLFLEGVMEENGIIIEENATETNIEKKAKKNINWAEVWDKFTTGLLLLFFASPLLVLLYIFIWFINR